MDGPGTHSATVSGNTLRQWANGAGLQLSKRNGSGNLNVTVIGNTITEPGQFAVNGILLNSGAATGDSGTSCVDIGGAGGLANNIAGSGANGGTDFRVRQRFNTTVQLPGYTGANTDTAAVVAYIQGRNAASPTGSATSDISTGGGGFVGGAACGGGANPTLLAEGHFEKQIKVKEISRPTQPDERIAHSESPALSDEQLNRVVAIARTQWALTGLTPEQKSALDRLQFTIADLPRGYLADAIPGLVRIDRQAAGAGWFIDHLPEGNRSYGERRSANHFSSTAGSPAAAGMDLLTTVLHEMGHALGLPDATGIQARDGLMFGSLLKGERRVPTRGEALGAIPGSVTSTHFLGGPLTVNIGILPDGKSITITFQAVVANPFTSGCGVTTQGTVSGSNFADVLSDDPNAPGSADPTFTAIPIAPTITCPADITVHHDPGVDGAVVTFAPTAGDPCSVPNVVCVPASGSTFPYGTTPVNCTATASALTAHCSFNVTVMPDLDFGDAPTAAQSGFASSYPTTLAQNGARHIIPAAGPTLYLGVVPPDAEPDGQPDPNALGDDTHGTADEDGVALPSSFVAGQTVNLTVTASAPGKLDAWIDWNRDGDWNDPGEQIFASRSVVAGPNVLSVTVPSAATLKGGKSFARFRLSSAGGLAPTGQAADGEVEDYAVLLDTPPVAGADTVQRNANEDVKVAVSALLANDTDAENDTLTITSVSSPSTGGAVVTLSGNWVYYRHNGTVPDSFTYTVSDGHGGTATGTVSVTINDPNAESRNTLSITVDGTGAHIRSDGIPNRTYTIQFKDNTNDPWQDLGTIAADAAGIYVFDDPAGTVSRFYRSVYRAP